jgi:hypothetical protein
MTMRLNSRVAIAFGAAALAACSQGGQESAGNVDANVGMTDESVVSSDNMGADTLGNQLNQLNSSDEATANGSDEATDNATSNTTNSY